MNFRGCAIRHAKRALPQRAWIRLGAGAASAAITAATLILAAPAGASTVGAAAANTVPRAVHLLPLNAMPVGVVAFGRDRRHRLTVSVVGYGFTPGSSHSVQLVSLGHYPPIRFSSLTANGAGQVRSTLSSSYTGPLGWWRSRFSLVIYMGVGNGNVARQPAARTALLSNPGSRPQQLIAVEYSYRGVSYGTPRGVATVSYSARRRTLTVTVSAGGVTPGLHAAHIHLGSCMSQGPVKYMLADLRANRHGRIVHAVRVFTNVRKPIPASGWYLNIHQGNSSQILSHGKPTIYFRPLLCADISGR